MLRTIDSVFSKGRSLKDLRLSNVVITKEITLKDDIPLSVGDEKKTQIYHDSATDNCFVNVGAGIDLIFNTDVVQITNSSGGYAQLLMRGTAGAFISLLSPANSTTPVDCRIEHAFNNTVFKSSTGTMSIIQQDLSEKLKLKETSKDFIVMTPGGGVEVYHNNVKQFQSTATGIRLNASTVPSGTSQPANLVSGDLWRSSSNGILHMVP
jgi:hypothetical protein